MALSLATAQKEATVRGGRCTSDTYVNCKSRLEWECHTGHTWSASLDSVRNSHTWCPHCSKTRKRSIEEAERVAAARNGECLTRVYKNGKTPLRWKCHKGHEWQASLVNVSNKGSWCPFCSGRRGRTLRQLQEAAAAKGGRCLAEAYTNMKAPIDWQCASGHTWTSDANHIVCHGRWCPQCSSLKLSIQDAMDAAARRGGSCLSREYVNSGSPLEWQCGEGHRWEASLAHVRNDGSWCPLCIYKGESETRALFERLTGHRFSKRRGLFLDHPGWELDGYCEALGVAFEYHGKQHYEVVPHFHRKGLLDLERQQARDAEVEARCLDLDRPIVLITVPYWLSATRREHFVHRELHSLGVLAT